MGKAMSKPPRRSATADVTRGSSRTWPCRHRATDERDDDRERPLPGEEHREQAIGGDERAAAGCFSRRAHMRAAEITSVAGNLR